MSSRVIKTGKFKSITVDGLPVRDANADVTFTVLQVDVEKGIRGDHRQCAAALALIRKFNTSVILGRTSTFIRKKSYYMRYSTGGALRAQMYVIDQGGQFEPGRYILKAPYLSVRKGNQKKTGPSLSQGRSIKVSRYVRGHL